jgi:hypothetical protein
MGASGPSYGQKHDENAEKTRKSMGLHYCDHYGNLVRFGELCEGCPHARKAPPYSVEHSVV